MRIRLKKVILILSVFSFLFFLISNYPIFAQSVGINSATDNQILPDGLWTWPLTPELTTELHNLMDTSINGAKLRYGSNTAKVVMLANSTSLLDDYAIKAQQAFPNALIVGTGTGSENYNAFTTEAFAEHGQRSVAILALGGTDITAVHVSGQRNVGQGGDAALIINAGIQVAQDLKPYINSSQKNLVYLMGPGHTPNHKLVLCGFKEGIANVTGQCDTANTENPELPGLPQLPNYIHVIGTGGYYNANTVVGTNLVSESVVCTLIQGNFGLSFAGLIGTPTPSNISTPINQITQELGGKPDFIFLSPGHPTVGAYDALRQQMVSLLPGSPIFGHEGGGEIGHDSTTSPAIADTNHLFMVGIKSSVNSSSSPVPILGDINNDRIVNILDYTLLSNAFGTNNASTDLNHDGIVNILDYTLLSNNFGRSG